MKPSSVAASLFAWSLFAACSNHRCLVFGFGGTNSPRTRVFVGTPVTNPRRAVGDCMTPNPRTLPVTTSVDEAISMLLNSGISGAPVLDKNGELAGIISSSSFLHKEDGGALLPMEGSAEAVEGFIDVAKKITAQTVGDIMSTEFHTIESTSSMRDAAALMAREKLHRLIVVDDNNEMVGILSVSDIMRDVLNEARGMLPQAAVDDALP